MAARTQGCLRHSNPVVLAVLNAVPRNPTFPLSDLRIVNNLRGMVDPSPASTPVVENLLMAPVADGFVVKGAFSGQTVMSGPNASVVMQQAIDRLAEGGGGRLDLGPGRYAVNRTIRLRSAVTVAGSGMGTRLLVGAPEGVLGHQVHRAEVRDLALIGRDEAANQGLVLDNSGDCRVSAVFAGGFVDAGILVRNGCFLCTVTDCSLAGNRGAGIRFQEHQRGRVGDFVTNTIAGCTVYGGGIGIEANETTVLNIIGCQVYQASGAGYLLHNNSNSVLVSGCRTFQITGHAVVAHHAGELNLTGNIFCWHTKAGIVMTDCPWGVISGNEVIDSGSWNSGAEDFSRRLDAVPADVPLEPAIHLRDVRGYSITGNTLFNWPQSRKMSDPVFVDAGCVDVAVTGNSINYFAGKPVVDRGSGTLLADNKAFAEKPYYGRDPETQMQSFQPERIRDFMTTVMEG